MRDRVRPHLLFLTPCLLGLALLFLPGSARGDDRILAFDSVVRVAEDGTLKVTENLRLVAEGDGARRGLLRVFSSPSREETAPPSAMGLEVLEVLRDGEKEPWRTENRGGTVRLFLGDPERPAPPGVHTYLISYRTAGQIAFRPDRDELRWNVTGCGWTLPVERATCRVLLPEDSGEVPPFLDLSATTGLGEDREGDVSYRVDADGSAAFESTRTLQPREDLRVTASWPKGTVVSSEEAAERLETRRGHGWFLGGCALSVLTLLYFLGVWSRVGRPPRPESLTPRLAPPVDFSPAACRLFRRRDFDGRTFVCALLDGAVKGALHLRREGEDYVLELRDQGWENLAPEETGLLRALFPGTEKVFRACPQGGPALRDARDRVRAALEKGLEDLLGDSNRGWWRGGVFLSLLAAGVLTAGRPEAPWAPLLGAAFLAWTLGVLGLLQKVRSRWSLWWRASEGRTLRLLQALTTTLLSLPFVVGEVLGAGLLSQEAGVPAAGTVALLGGLDAVFRRLLATPGGRGLRILRQIEAFRLYLACGEGGPGDRDKPPTRTPELYERFLPYALALDAERPWGESFAPPAPSSEVARRIEAPFWYEGEDFDPTLPGAFLPALEGRLLTLLQPPSPEEEARTPREETDTEGAAPHIDDAPGNG